MFQKQPPIAEFEGFGRGTIEPADLDGDGDLDVLIASAVGFGVMGRVAWHENLDGQGEFGTERVIVMGTRDYSGPSFSAKAGDVDGDGDLDILASSYSDLLMASYELAWYENTDGHGNYSQVRSIATDLAISAFVTGDFDQDADLDVVAIDSAANRLLVYKNMDMEGRYELSSRMDLDAEIASISVADVDGDGHSDLLTLFARRPGTNATAVAWFRNVDGTGSFGPPIAISEPERATDIAAADVDGDGDQDVLYSHRSETSLASWQENLDGQGAFGEMKTIATRSASDGSSRLLIIPADIDNDGDIDVFDGISWHENLTGTGRVRDTPFRHGCVVEWCLRGSRQRW